MRLAGVDFPRRLIETLERGELVVFAGAGVSMGPPANLPNFEGLAAAIAVGTGETQQPSEPVDRFLGRLKGKGADVHERATEALRSGNPEQTALQGDLLRLYRTPQSVRVVTTNFDALFEQAASHVFESAPSVFMAPALPLGTSFSGIVHVHGDLDHPQGMVLTDADFGRAYLTEGWARRFLVDLFRTHPVLFVGYSHSDTVMNYLSRALPPGAGDRFALTDQPDNEEWQLLGVEPIGYVKSAEDDHSALAEGIRRLANYSRQAAALEVGLEQGVCVERNIGKESLDNPVKRASERDRHRRPLPRCECLRALEHVQHPQMRRSKDVDQVQERRVQVVFRLVAQGDVRQGALQCPPLLLSGCAESNAGRCHCRVDPLVVG